jgi:hypothetical protein
MYKLSDLMNSNTQQKITSGRWIPAKPMSETMKPFRRRIKEAWCVLIGKASTFTWE